jgi:YVTN family beta-propeller protein
VTGGDDTQSQSLTNMTGMVYVIDIRARKVVAQVTNVGIEPYGVTIVEGSD